MKFIVFIVALFVGCTTAPKETPEPNLSASEIPKGDSTFQEYRFDTRAVFYHDIVPPEKVVATSRFHLPSMLFETMNLALKFGLMDHFSSEDFTNFAFSMFELVPLTNISGEESRRVVIPRYYINGDPLVFLLSFYLFDGELKLVWFSNSKAAKGDWNPAQARREGPLVELPRLIDSHPRRAGGFVKNGLFHLLSGGFVTSLSESVILKAPESMDDEEIAFRAVNFYIRDGNPDNDAWIAVRLGEIGRDEERNPILRTMAYLNLTLHYFYLGEGDLIVQTMEELERMQLLDHHEIKGTIVEEIGRRFNPYLVAAYLRVQEFRKATTGRKNLTE